MRAVVDFREKPSGIIDLMIAGGIDVQVKQMAHGDFILDGVITVERKTAGDFIVSIIDGRLFRQMANLKKNCDHPVLLIEGNPFRTGLKMSRSCYKRGFVECSDRVEGTGCAFAVNRGFGRTDADYGLSISKNVHCHGAEGRIPATSIEHQTTLRAAGLSGNRPTFGETALESFWVRCRGVGRLFRETEGRQRNRPVTAETIREVLDAEWSLP